MFSFSPALVPAGFANKFPPNGSLLSGSNGAKQKEREELASNFSSQLPNNFRPPPSAPGIAASCALEDGGGSIEPKTFCSSDCTDYAANVTCIGTEEPATPRSLHDFKRSETNNDQGNRVS